MTIRIVTDSTCDLPSEVIKELGINVIPLYINIGKKGFLDGVEITRKEFYTQLPDYEDHPTTGTPGIDVFSRLYKKLADEGATQIISIHISKSLSATVEIAKSAAKAFKQIPVMVRDSDQLSIGTGFQVEEAARMAMQGKSLEDISKSMIDLAKRTFVAARLNTLDYLRRSGRMNAVMTGIGTLLQLKPILTMKNGQPGSERVRTNLRAENRLVEMLETYQPIERFALLHTNAAAKAEDFRKRITHLIPKTPSYSMDITPVIGSHIGPGASGFAIVTKK
ncbi:MAG: DegV family protein [Anaerolineaceae bacterium]|nr:DegV family protein [Anaerolineaceae bacterium]